MTDTKLRVVVDAVWQGASALDKAGRDLENAKKKASDATKGLQNLAKEAAALGGAAVAAGAVFKQAFDLAKAGNQIKQTEDRFIALNESIDAVASDTLVKLQKATDNSISDMKLMEGANLLLSTGVARTDDELTKLIENVVKLKKPTDSASDAIENFSLLMANQSIPRLDSFGISASAVRGRIKELQEQTKGLSREAAFNEAVMAEMEISLGNVGQAGEFTADVYTQLEVEVENLNNGFKQWLAEGLTPVLVEGRRLNEAMQKFKGESALSAGFVDKLTHSSIQADLAMKNWRSSAGLTRGQLAGLTDETEDLTDEVDEGFRAVTTYERAGIALGRSLLQQSVLTEQAAIETEEMTEAQRLAAEEAAKLAAIEAELAAKTGEYFNAALEADEQTKSLTARLFESGQQAGLSAEQTALLGVATGELTEEQAEAALKTAILQVEIDKLVQAYAAGDISAHEAAEAARELTGDLEGVGKAADITTAKLNSIPRDIKIRISTTIDGDVGVRTEHGETRAHGGSVNAGGMFTVGERGPEVFVPSSDGFIIPNNQVNNTFNFGGVSINEAQSPAQTVNQVLTELGRQTRAANLAGRGTTGRTF